MNARVIELRAKGVDVFAFGVGEPDFEPPQAVLDAAKRAIDAGCSKYTAVTGIAPLKQAICDFTEATRGWRPEPANVCVSVGAKHVLFNLAIALYEASGFRQFGEHAHYYADGATALRYEKSLLLAACRESGNNPPAEGVPTLPGASRPRNVGRKGAG